MEAIVVCDTSDREKWKQHRSEGIGASDIPAILGCCPYRTPYELWAKKTGKLITEYSDAAWFGNEIEPLLARLYERKTGITLHREQVLYKHKDYDFALATPDYYREEGGRRVRVQLKHTAGTNKGWHSAEMPLWVVAQVMWESFVLGEDVGEAFALIGGHVNAAKPYLIPYEPSFIERILEDVYKFWELVQTDVPPVMEPSDLKLLKHTVKNRAGRLELAEEHIPLLKELARADAIREEAKKMLKDAEYDYDSARVKMAAVMGSHEEVVYGRTPVMRVTHNGTRFNVLKGIKIFEE